MGKAPKKASDIVRRNLPHDVLAARSAVDHSGGAIAPRLSNN